MATLDEINILDRVKTDPQLLLQAGRQPTAEPIPPTFNPASDYFYNNVLNDSGRKMLQFAKSEANNPFNFVAGAGMIGKANKVRQGIAGIGHNRGPSLNDSGTGTVVSDDVARKIFDVDKEMDDLYDLRKRKKRVDDQYVFNEKLTDKDRDLLEIEADALEKAIKNLEYKTMGKIEKRFETNIASRTIDELDPRRIDRPSKEQIASLAVGEKNRDILKNVEGYVDSPGFNSIYDNTYGAEKFSTQLHRLFKGSDKDIEDPDYLYNYTEMMTEGPMTKVNKEGIASLKPIRDLRKVYFSTRYHANWS
jgi:hypothetical protein